MAIRIKLIKNNIKRSSAYGKYFAKTVSQGEVTFDELVMAVCERNGMSQGAAVGLLTDLRGVLKKKLGEGQTVVLDGIGRFSLRVESEGVDDPNKFSLRRHITRIVCGFLPAGRRGFGRRIQYDVCRDVQVEWDK